MSFFAVLDVENENARKRFDVDQLHVNVWSLASLFPWRRSLVVDIGVALTAREDVSGISLALPFRTVAVKDLSEYLTDNRTASLIFDSVAWYDPRRSELRADGSPMRLLRMDAKSGREDGLSSDSLTVWGVNFVRRLKAGRTGYFRMRFEVEPSRSWEWQPTAVLRRKSGLLVDLRVADVRSTVELAGGESILSRVCKINRAYIFAVLPQSLSPSTVSPEPSYIRLLEPRVWGRYLDRKAEFFGRRLVVYQWKSDKHPDGKPSVTINRPIRLYGRFNLRTRYGTIRAIIVATVLAIGAVAVLLEAPFRPEVVAVWNQAVATVVDSWAFIFVPLGIGLASFAVQTFRWLRGVKDLWTKFETWVFRKLFRPES